MASKITKVNRWMYNGCTFVSEEAAKEAAEGMFFAHLRSLLEGQKNGPTLAQIVKIAEALIADRSYVAHLLDYEFEDETE
jgi:hypothetical protein